MVVDFGVGFGFGVGWVGRLLAFGCSPKVFGVGWVCGLIMGLVGGWWVVVGGWWEGYWLFPESFRGWLGLWV